MQLVSHSTCKGATWTHNLRACEHADPFSVPGPGPCSGDQSGTCQIRLCEHLANSAGTSGNVSPTLLQHLLVWSLSLYGTVALPSPVIPPANQSDPSSIMADLEDVRVEK